MKQLTLFQKPEEKLTIEQDCLNGCPTAVKPVVLHGIHIATHTPTEERLTVQIEGLSPEKFRDLAVALEDWMEVVDENYKKKTTRGRGWKGRGKRITAATRVRIIKFSPFPSSFSNVLRTVRKNLYYALHRHCLVLEGEQHGGYRQNIYILPYGSAPEFMNELQLENAKIDELNVQISDFLKTQDYQDIHELLKGYSIERVLQAKTWTVEHISFDATPLALEPATVKTIVEDEYARMFRKLEDHERRGLEMLQQELERKREILVRKGIENLQKKITVITKRIVASAKKKPEKVREDLERLRRIAVSVGLEALATSVIDPLAQIVEHPEKTMEIFGTKQISDAVDSRIRSLIESL